MRTTQGTEESKMHQPRTRNSRNDSTKSSSIRRYKTLTTSLENEENRSYNSSFSTVLTRDSTSHFSASESTREAESQQVMLTRTTTPGDTLDGAASTSFYGRDTILKSLEAQYHQSKQSRQLALLHGESGTGKSRITQELRRLLVAREDSSQTIQVMGKCDFRQQNKPYAVIAGACNAMCRRIAQRSKTLEQDTTNGASDHQFTWAQIQSKLEEALGPHYHRIVEVVPDLRLILDERSSSLAQQKTSSASSKAYTESKYLFNMAFLAFVRSICNFFSVLMILDDLQWADPSSISLIEELLSDTSNKSIMIIGIYRSLDVDGNHSLAKLIRDMHPTDALREAGIYTREYKIGDLSIPDLARMFEDLFSSEYTNVLPFAECIYAQTKGNIFFVTQMLRRLMDERLLVQGGDQQWTWDMERVERETTTITDVVEIMTEKFKRMSGNTRQLVPLIASLGSTFCVGFLQIIFDHFCSLPDVAEDDDLIYGPDSFLKECKGEGFIRNIDDETYAWEHDKIQEAALTITDPSTLSALQFQLGELLLDRLDRTSLQNNIFTVANLLIGSVWFESTDSRRTSAAELLMNAGKKALSLAAFELAVKYFDRAIEILPLDCWDNHYELTLDVYSSAAECEFCLGNLEKSQFYCDTILSRDERPLLDKKRAYMVLLASYRAKGEMDVARILCMRILTKLGFHLPRRGLPTKIATVFSFLRFWRSSKALLNNLDKLQEMTDDKHIWTGELIDNLSSTVFQCAPDMTPLLLFRGLEWTMQLGHSDFGPIHLCSAAVMLMKLGKVEEAKEYTTKALELCEKKVAKESKCILISNIFVVHWYLPHDECLRNFLRGYESGMRTGDMENGGWCCVAYIETALNLGKDFHILDDDCKVYATQLKRMKQEKILLIVSSMWQIVKNLSGQGRSGSILKGDVFDEYEELAKSRSQHKRHITQTIILHRLYLAFWFADFERFMRIAQEERFDQGEFDKDSPGSGSLLQLHFQLALAALVLARRTNNKCKAKRYKKIGLKFRRKMLDHGKKGNPNVSHRIALLDAERFVLLGDRKQAEEAFLQAIRSSINRGWNSDIALSYERYAGFLVECKEFEDARDNLTSAMEVYDKCGAFGKTRKVRRQHWKLLGEKGPKSKSDETSSSTNSQIYNV